MDQAEKMLLEKNWAVVGATDNESKFGYRIFKHMVDKKMVVYPVNPGVKSVYGRTCYASLADLPVRPTAVDIVVPPKVAEQIVQECASLGIRNVWLQPGSDVPKVIELAKQLGLTVVTDCILQRTR